MRGSEKARVANSRLAIMAAVVAWSGVAIFPLSSASAEQRTFATPEQAVEALVAAARAGRADDLLTILGRGSKMLLSSGDAVADARARRRFILAYQEKNQIKGESDSRAVLAIGKDDWTFPFPIVKRAAVWRFDATAGFQEILQRRVGANELDTIEVCHAYVDAQREYAEKDRNGNGYLEYAEKFLSSPGRRDGLYWPTGPGEEESPIGPLMVVARDEGYSTPPTDGHRPYHGYYYRILKGQGPAAKGGAYDYVVNGHMIAGFALVAFPAQYRASGVMTFIVNHDGVVYQKDLGPRTAELAEAMTLFDPDSGWTTP